LGFGFFCFLWSSSSSCVKKKEKKKRNRRRRRRHHRVFVGHITTMDRAKEHFFNVSVDPICWTMDLAKAAPTVPDCQAAAAAPPARPAAYDTTLDHAPFETMEKYYPCPQAGISRSLMTGDVKGAQVCTTIRDPLDPMVKIKILDGLPPSHRDSFNIPSSQCHQEKQKQIQNPSSFSPSQLWETQKQNK
jgi:hypothetical protein